MTKGRQGNRETSMAFSNTFGGRMWGQKGMRKRACDKQKSDSLSRSLYVKKA